MADGNPVRASGSNVIFEVRLSDEGFAIAARAIYILTLQSGRVATLRTSAVNGFRSILLGGRDELLALLSQHDLRQMAGAKKFYIQFSTDENELAKEVRKIVRWTDPDREPANMAQVIMLGWIAGCDAEAVERLGKTETKARRKQTPKQ